MGKNEEILPNLYGVPLENSFYDLINEYSRVFFIVDHTGEQEYIDVLATKILKAECRDYVFFGTYAEKWNDSIEKIDFTLNREKEKDPISSSGWMKLSNFTGDLLRNVVNAKRERRNLYLVYDDDEEYNQVKRALKHSCRGVGAA